MSKPLFIWAGGKNKMLKHYIPILPSPLEMSIKSYVEPFFGGGAMFIHIMKHHQPKEVYINDINPDIVSIYECIKNNYNEFLKRVIDLETQYLPMNMEDRRKFFFKIRHDHAYEYENWSKPYESATLYFLMKTAFNGIFQINQNTNNRYGTPCGLLNQKDKVFDRDVVKWWNNVLQKVNISSGDWKTNTPDIQDAFYFFDPPYRDSFADYGNSFGDEQLKELIKFADGKDKSFVCNRDSSDGWFDKEKKSMNIRTFDITYTAGRRKKTKDGYQAKKAKEVLLWHMN
jgi:DNA adenine methylase|tara:strand:+ start:199 stop:1056 length:858 start_codon:yes stop_codon:yes gene_type:complete